MAKDLKRFLCDFYCNRVGFEFAAGLLKFPICATRAGGGAQSRPDSDQGSLVRSVGSVLRRAGGVGGFCPRADRPRCPLAPAPLPGPRTLSKGCTVWENKTGAWMAHHLLRFPTGRVIRSPSFEGWRAAAEVAGDLGGGQDQKSFSECSWEP